MDKFRELSIFLTVAGEGAFNRAARKTGLSASVVTRLINSLETRLGTMLFTRTTRHVSLTEAGQRLYEEAGRILADLEEAEAIAAGAHQNVQGNLNITAPVMFGQRYLMPIIREYLDTWPSATVTTAFLDRTVHIVEEGFDLALRIGRLPDSSLYTRKVGEVRYMIVAAPSCLENASHINNPDDLAHHPIIKIGDRSTPDEWLFESGGNVTRVRFSPRLVVNSVTAALDAALQGWGLIRTLSYQVADAIEQGNLVEVLPQRDDRKIPVQLVYPEGRRIPAKTAAFIDIALRQLRTAAPRFSAM